MPNRLESDTRQILHTLGLITRSRKAPEENLRMTSEPPER